MANVVLSAARSSSLDLEAYNPDDFLLTDGQTFSPTKYFAASESRIITLEGSGFTYSSPNVPATGLINRISVENGRVSVDITGLNYSAARFNELIHLGTSSDNITRLYSELYAGDDRFQGSAHGELIRAFAGDDTVNGGGGDDRIVDASGANYLRGDEGNDSIVGGSDFDDINGNMGNDTASGGLGEDWVVGGKDNDSLSGGAAYDLVYGNLGNDTCDGGEGNDIVRGGQQDDILFGGAGDDFMAGDRDNDTLTGGAGADTFSTHGEAGIDRITDFSQAQGDRVQLNPGTQYTLAQVGADTVINMTGGGQAILVGVQMSSLTPGWIFGN